MQANKMKVLFLTLVLGLVCSSQEIPAEPHHSEENGELITSPPATQKRLVRTGHSTFIFAASNLTKGDSLVFHFFVKNNGACTESSVSGRRIANNVYVAEYAGANEFHFILVSDDGLIVNTENVDEAGNRTRLVGLLGKEDEVDDHDLERFLEEVRKLGIPEENIVDFTKGESVRPDTSSSP